MRKIKVAVISDVHGNIVALEEILKDCRQNNVDKYIFTGDMITELPFVNETLDLVKSLTNFVVRGNKEEYIIEYHNQKFEWDNIQFKNSIFLYNLLTKENLDYINKLPITLSLEFDGVKLLVCHGSPEAVEEQIHIVDTDKIDKYTKNLKEDILILGHTHEKIWDREYNGKLVLNAGCSGVSPYNIDKAEYVILNLDNRKIRNYKTISKI